MTYIYIIDINECQTGTHNCDQLCTNTHGSFTCSCMSGYTLQSDQRTCTGIPYKIICKINTVVILTKLCCSYMFDSLPANWIIFAYL
jgi:hypothetical protein